MGCPARAGAATLLNGVTNAQFAPSSRLASRAPRATEWVLIQGGQATSRQSCHRRLNYGCLRVNWLADYRVELPCSQDRSGQNTTRCGRKSAFTCWSASCSPIAKGYVRSPVKPRATRALRRDLCVSVGRRPAQCPANTSVGSAVDSGSARRKSRGCRDDQCLVDRRPACSAKRGSFQDNRRRSRLLAPTIGSSYTGAWCAAKWPA